jgi:hypothetical protein
MPGIADTASIDVVAHDPQTDAVVLIMREPRPWDGSERQLFQLQEKINAYLSFALDGEMTAAFPQFAGKPVVLRLECIQEPAGRAVQLIAAVRHQIAFQEITFDVRIVEDLKPEPLVENNGCCSGGGCGCK